MTQVYGLGPYVALKLVAECGTDMSRWPNAKHFASWLPLSALSRNKISGGKVRSSKTIVEPSRGRVMAGGYGGQSDRYRAG